MNAVASIVGYHLQPDKHVGGLPVTPCVR